MLTISSTELNLRSSVILFHCGYSELGLTFRSMCFYRIKEVWSLELMNAYFAETCFRLLFHEQKIICIQKICCYTQVSEHCLGRREVSSCSQVSRDNLNYMSAYHVLHVGYHYLFPSFASISVNNRVRIYGETPFRQDVRIRPYLYSTSLSLLLTASEPRAHSPPFNRTFSFYSQSPRFLSTPITWVLCFPITQVILWFLFHCLTLVTERSYDRPRWSKRGPSSGRFSKTVDSSKLGPPSREHLHERDSEVHFRGSDDYGTPAEISGSPTSKTSRTISESGMSEGASLKTVKFFPPDKFSGGSSSDVLDWIFQM